MTRRFALGCASSRNGIDDGDVRFSRGCFDAMAFVTITNGSSGSIRRKDFKRDAGGGDDLTSRFRLASFVL
jgi:hypothetical protein